MKICVWIILLLSFSGKNCFADTLVMKSGENKKGKILEVTKDTVLFNSQTLNYVVEVPRKDISMIDRDDPATRIAPLESQKKLLGEAEKMGIKLPTKNGAVDQEGLFQTVVKMAEDWMLSHPEAEKFILYWVKIFKGKSDQLEEMVRATKEA